MKLEFHFLKNRSIFQRWLLSYFSILVIPLIISNIVFINTENIVQQEVKRANTALLKQMQQTVDARIQEIGTLSFQIGMSPNLIKFLNTQSSQYANDPLSKFSILPNFLLVYLIILGDKFFDGWLRYRQRRRTSLKRIRFQSQPQSEVHWGMAT